MIQEGITQIDIKQVLRQKAPSAARKIPGFMVDYLIRTVHQDELNEILRRYHDKDGVAFMQELIGYFDLNLELVNEENIPAEGRYIFASNHPLGGLDGICLSAIIGGRFDGKIRYLVNDLLLYLSNLRSIFVPINKHGAQGKKNAEWKKSFIQKAVEYRRDIVPVFFEGRNSNFFYCLANMRKALGIKMNYEMIYLPDEMFKSKHKTYSIHFGKPIPWQTFDSSRKPAEWAEWVKEIVYNLKK